MGRSFDRHNAHTSQDEGSGLHLPIGLAELLHSMLAPLAEQLAAEDHPWHALAQKVVDEYCELRNSFVRETHGSSALADITHEIFLASEKVCELTSLAIDEACDFAAWATEVSGETA